LETFFFTRHRWVDAWADRLFTMVRCVFVLLVMSFPALAQDGLPEFIALKTPSQSFNNHHDFALKDGRIWYRPRRVRSTEPALEWKLLGKGGVPFRPEGPSKDDPAQVVELSADATGLVAIAPDGRIFDGELDGQGEVRWQYLWGFPYRMLPQPVYLPPSSERSAWAYSLLNQEGSYSEDIDGNPHTIKRIDTVYVLSRDGRSIRFNDPWLPPNRFEFQIAGPLGGGFSAVALAASGSTLLVMNRSGEMYTRMVDFDTLGGNPGITYSYQRRRLPSEAEDQGATLRGEYPFLFDVRSLPSEAWRAQPPIPGRFTRRLTVFQNGKGNAARELRVEGEDAEGHPGYWFKPIFGKTWSFVVTDQTVSEAWVIPGAAAVKVPPLGEDLEGTARVYPSQEGTPVDLRASLVGFNVYFDPTVLRLFPADGGAPLEATLYLQPDVAPIPERGTKRLVGAFLLPESSGEDGGRAELREKLGSQPIHEVFVVISPESVEIQSNPHSRVDHRSYRMRFGRSPKSRGGVEGPQESTGAAIK